MVISILQFKRRMKAQNLACHFRIAVPAGPMQRRMSAVAFHRPAAFEHQPDGEATGGYFAHTGFNSGYLSLMMGSKSGGNGIVIMINVSPEDMSTSQIPEYTFLTDLVARVGEEEGWT